MRKDKLNNETAVFYSLLQAFYWAGCVFTIVFCAAYLKSYGFENKSIGLVVAVSNALGFILANAFSSSIDSGRLSTVNICRLIVPLQIIFAILLLVSKSVSSYIIEYTGVFSLCLCLGPLYTKLCIDLNHSDCRVNFGLCRGIGSVSYALVSLFAGLIIRVYTVKCMPYCIIIMNLLQGIVLIMIQVKGNTPCQKNSRIVLFNHINKDIRWIVFAIGIALLFAAENTFNSFRPNIVYNSGGGDEQLGYLSSLKAFCEIPVMMMYSKLSDKYKDKNILIFSLIFFAIKMFLISASKNMSMLYFAFIFNTVSYGLYTPAVVEYIDKNVPYSESAKIQLLCGSVTTLGTVAATLSFGYMFDNMSIRSSLIALTAIGAVGIIIAILNICNTKSMNR